MAAAVEPIAVLVEPEVVAPQPGVVPVALVDPVVLVLPVVVPLLEVVVVPPVVVPVLVPPVVDVAGVVLTVAVCAAPFANLALALADTRLPLASRVYCAVPVPAPQAVSITDTPVKAVSESVRMAVTSNDTFNIK